MAKFNCDANNFVRKIPKKINSTSTRLFEYLHMDLAEMPVESYDGYKYFLIVKDEFFKFRVAILI